MKYLGKIEDEYNVTNKGYVDEVVKAVKDLLAGGSSGQVLAKNSDTAYDFGWKTLSVPVITRDDNNNLKIR